jgi:hypothetical protein
MAVPIGPPPSSVWPGYAWYRQPLPSHLDWDPVDDFPLLTAFIERQAARGAGPRGVLVNPVVATYRDDKQKRVRHIPAYGRNAGTTSAFLKHFPATRPTVGIVVSPMSNAVELPWRDSWHAVAVARDGADLFVYDPAYTGIYSTDARIRDVPGTGIV